MLLFFQKHPPVFPRLLPQTEHFTFVTFQEHFEAGVDGLGQLKTVCSVEK